MQITILLTMLGAAVTVAGYLQPATQSLTGHELFHSWDISYAALGYSEQELIARLRVGATWNAATCISYMAMVLGGYLNLTIYRIDGGNPSVPTADIGELPAGESPQSDSLRKRIKSLFGPGRLSGRPIWPETA